MRDAINAVVRVWRGCSDDRLPGPNGTRSQALPAPEPTPLRSGFACRWPGSALWAAMFLAVIAPRSASAQRPAYPPSEARPVTERLHGETITDPYRWLEDQESADTRAWIDAQNRFREEVMADLPGIEPLEQRLGDLLETDQMSTPVVRGNRYFFSKRAAGQDLFAIYMREGAEGRNVSLIDPHVMATDIPLSVGLQDVSDDGTLIAYSIRQGGQDEVLVRFYDVDGRHVLPDHLPKARYFGVRITPDRSAIYFTRYGPEGPRLYHRPLTGEDAPERLVYGEELGPEKIMSAQISDDGRWLLVAVSEGTSGGNDMYLKDLASDAPPLTMVVGTGKNYDAAFAGDRIVIRTDEGAPNGRVFVAHPSQPSRELWREIVPEAEHVIQGVSLAGGVVWVNYLEDVVDHLRGFDIDGSPVRDIEPPSLGSISGLTGDFDQDEAFYSFTSYDTPATTYRYSVSRDERSVWHAQDVDFDSDAYEVKQVWYMSKDGTRVPMFLAHRTGLELDGTNPTFLTAYGGFNISLTPGFGAQYAVWLERGGVLAVPNLRGGGEFGEAWHQAGMFENKQNVFDDFIAAAEWLIDEGYTSPDRLAIAGGSNGGLLVGAAMTQRPELYRAVVCSVPLLDMLRYHQFLVGRYWVSEYGSADDPEQFEYLRAYSPYHNVVDGVEYPAVLFETGDGDTRVAPLHARKMTALMQAATGSDHPILLRYDTEAGHSGGLPVSKTIEDVTTRLSFVMWQLGMLDRGAS